MSESLSLVSPPPQGGEASANDPEDSGGQTRSAATLDKVENDSQDSKGKSRISQLMPILTALIAMIGTLGVSIINRPHQAQSQSAHADKKLIISGTVLTEGEEQPLSGVDVFLLPDGNNLETQTDDSGRFSLQGVPGGTYSIIIRDSSQGSSGRIRLDESLNKAPVKKMGAKVEYNIRQ